MRGVSTAIVLYLAVLPALGVGGPNLLPNAGFIDSTNPRVPDYWDLHHVAVLTLSDVHSRFSIDPSVVSPVPGTKVLRIQNPSAEFHHMALASTRLGGGKAAGPYTFSVYIRSDESGKTVEFSPAWAQGEQVRWTEVGQAWQRRSVTFEFPSPGGLINGNAVAKLDQLQPMLRFPFKGTYYVAAPQLEIGSVPTPFQLGALPRIWSVPESSYKPTGVVGGAFEYDTYRTGSVARLQLFSTLGRSAPAVVRCQTPGVGGTPAFKGGTTVPGDGVAVISIQLEGVLVGQYSCEIAFGEDSVLFRSISVLEETSVTPMVRLNRLRRIPEVKGVPLFIRGIAVSGAMIPEDWYFNDLRDRHFNTVFYVRHLDHSLRDPAGLRLFLDRAASAGLKVIVGVAMAGKRPRDWREKLASFNKLVDSIKSNPTIIAWYPLDEPSSNEWTDADLITVYREIRNADPSRLVFSNWAYDGVPRAAYQEPRGTLKSTDVYSFSDYPYAVYGGGLSRFSANLARINGTSRLTGTASHAWLQLYSGFDAWREPSAAELRYMVYASLAEGAMYSYWDSKSSSPANWEQVATLNLAAKKITALLHENSFASLQGVPVRQGGAIYSVWKEGQNVHIIVANGSALQESIEIDMSDVKGTAGSPISSMSGRPRMSVNSGGSLVVDLAPYDGDVLSLMVRPD